MTKSKKSFFARHFPGFDPTSVYFPEAREQAAQPDTSALAPTKSPWLAITDPELDLELALARSLDPAEQSNSEIRDTLLALRISLNEEVSNPFYFIIDNNAMGNWHSYICRIISAILIFFRA
jgi:hypothetical protein